MASKYIKENLLKLSKEQLVYIIERYYDACFMISETLVEESKWHIEKKDAVEKIREYLSNTHIDLYDDHLGEYIDMKQGKISGKEYRRIILGVEDE
jgi:hypothetical protein